MNDWEDEINCGGDPLEGLEPCDSSPGLMFGQQVTITKGIHSGKIGKAYRVKSEGTNHRIELIVSGEHIFVNKDEIDFQFDSASILLYCRDDEELAGLQARIKEIEESEDHI